MSERRGRSQPDRTIRFENTLRCSSLMGIIALVRSGKLDQKRATTSSPIKPATNPLCGAVSRTNEHTLIWRSQQIKARLQDIKYCPYYSM